MHGQEALPDRASEQGFGTHQLVQLSTASKPTLLSDYAESNFRVRCYRTPSIALMAATGSGPQSIEGRRGIVWRPTVDASLSRHD